ncbi:MAG: hypothetical protein EOP86_28055 [Verrucomicrobiaceae bacterium]|nr:MAG: hypothetical protein EOP86_28055 [Verrucomicrobiaceae bacterium]
MARFYSNENFPFAAVRFLRELGHDVLTTRDAERDNQAIPDDQVLDYATSLGRCVLTLNRRDFIHLHNANSTHAGIVICKADNEFRRLAECVHDAAKSMENFNGRLLRVTRGAPNQK